MSMCRSSPTCRGCTRRCPATAKATSSKRCGRLQVNGQPVTRAFLRNGDRVTIGTSCQFQFRQPVPVSTSARLDMVSGHRLPVGIDGVVLMADTLVLGSGTQVHVTIPDLKEPIVLFRGKDGLGYRHKGSLVINGRKSAGTRLAGRSGDGPRRRGFVRGGAGRPAAELGALAVRGTAGVL